MITVCLLVTFLGFWLCYQTSNRAQLLTPNKVEKWARQEKLKSNSAGVVFLFAGLFLSIISLGFGSGIFAYIMMLTVISSLVVLLAPIGIISFRSAMLILVLCFTVEILFHASK